MSALLHLAAGAEAVVGAAEAARKNLAAAMNHHLRRHTLSTKPQTPIQYWRPTQNA
jgi:hypothetical protein